ncbi:OmpA family protein [uncultured Parabacteroides sp.]|uniref:OmpA family protein n=1 Tax=uncultured Parabacteroides sp. TaxID=512312 RepID=UPI00262C763C|nr:OmpA family protein [uncultured Parabacteroides sp.]
MNKKVILIGVLLGTLPLGAVAQEALKSDTIHTELRSDFLEELGDTTDLVVAGKGTKNWFISLSGGVNSLAAEANRDYDNFVNRARLSFRLSTGKWFTPVWGFRVQMGVGKLSGHSFLLNYYNMYDQVADHSVMPEGMLPYLSEKDGRTWFHRKFTYMDWSVNLMTDAVRWFTKEKKPVGLILSAGPGFAHGFASQGLSATNSFAFNAGIMLNVSVHKNWDIFAELQGNIVDETFDGQIGGQPGQRNFTVEGYAGLNVGISYKFGGRKFARYAKVHPVTYESVRYILPPTRVEKPVSVEDVVTTFAVRFLIDKYNIEEDQKLNIDRIARYMKRHPESRLELVGFADKETAYPAYNMKLSERRVKAVRDYLVKKCGISAERLVLDAKGDTKRAYNEDYRWNRAVVMQIIENDNKE